MLPYTAQPTISRPVTSCLPWNRPNLCLGGNNKSLVVGVKHPKDTKVVGGSRNPDSYKMHDILRGRTLAEGTVFQQELVVRSFDVNGDSKMSLVALANYLQDTSMNHLERIGLQGEGFSTPEMTARGLVWVYYKIDIAIDRFPSWLDVIQVHTWMYESGKTGFGIDWIFSDLKTGKPLIQASSLFILMDKKTRKLSKFVKEIKKELKPYLMSECSPLIKNTRKLQVTDMDKIDFTRLGLSPGWNDMDMNQHVNNAKYFEWILEGTPTWIMTSHQLSSLSLEFRKECGMEDTLKCLSKYVGNYNSASDTSATGKNNEALIGMEHSLCLDSGLEIARARTLWKPKHSDSYGRVYC